MSRSGRLLALLLSAFGVLVVVYLLVGEGMGDGTGTGRYADGGIGGEALDPLTAPGLEAAGRKPKSEAEIAAEESAREAAAKAALRGEGIYGTVQDGQGRPIAGARVHLLPDPPEDRQRQGMPDRPPLATATSAKDGSYVVGPAPADAIVKLRAEAAGYAPTIKRVQQRGARVDLILDRGGALDVRVLDGAGQAIVDATVVHQAASVVTTGQTDDTGLARFAALPTGTGKLVVTKDGFGAVRDNSVAVAPGEKEERTLVMPRALDIAGTVLRGSDKLPLAGVEVSVRYPNLPTLSAGASVKTGEDGRFQIRANVGGQEQVIVRARKRGFAEGRAWRNASSKGEVSIELLDSGEAVTGRVLAADRQPVGGVRVLYTSLGAEDPKEVPETKTQADGTFTLALPAWANVGWSLNVAALSETHGIGVASFRVQKKEAGPPKPLKIELGGTGSLQGVVTDGAGQALQGAIVSLAPDWNAMSRPARRGRMSWQVLQLVGQGPHYNLSAATGADGSYLIPGIPALDYRVTASFGLDQTTLTDSVTVAAEEVAEADVSLGEGGTIEGWIVDSEEKPVPGAYVSANPTQRRGWGWWMDRPNARSQSDGRFVLRGVSDKRYNVSANASGYGHAQEKNVSAGMKEVTLRLKALGWIEGVVYHEGAPYRGTFTVKAQPLKNEPSSNNIRAPVPAGMWRPGQQQRTFNTDDGRFKIKGLKAGDYTVQASTPDGLIGVQKDVVTVMDGRASREARLDLQAGAVLRGVVRDDETGRPIPNAWVYANARSGEATDASGATSGNAQTDAKGRYEIRGLGGGAYTVTVWTREGSSFSAVVDVQASAEKTLDLARQRPGMIQFTVVDERGQPLADARPHVQSTNGNYVSVNVSAMKKDGLIGESYDWRTLWNTDAAGTLTRYHVPPGSLTVWATLRGYVMAGEKPVVEVRSGRVTPVQITLKKKDEG